MFREKKKVLVTGSSGLAGSAVQHLVKEEQAEDEEWIFLTSKDANLL